MERIFSESEYHTSTGRVTFHEPNLQNVPRDFQIKINKGGETEEVQNKTLPASPGEVFQLSLRSIFVPFPSAVFVSADYSQLELRIIAHLSSDVKLIRILNTAGDVFRGIASEVHRTTEDRVTPVQRQHAKEICYGIIYGMGAKSLSEQLGVSEEDASAYMEQFKDKYVGVKRYIRTCVETTSSTGIPDFSLKTELNLFDFFHRKKFCIFFEVLKLFEASKSL